MFERNVLMKNWLWRKFIIIVASWVIFLCSGALALETYPTIFIHGHLGAPEHLDYLVNKVGEGKEIHSPVYSGDTDNLAENSATRDSIWNFGYYKESENDTESFPYEGKIGGCPYEDTAKLGYKERTSYAHQLKRAVENILKATGSTKVNIVAHSMGGIVARSYIRWLGGEKKVNKLLMLGTPNHGMSNQDRDIFMDIFGILQPSPRWMLHGEIAEMTRGHRFFHGRSFMDWLNDSDETWGSVRYATVAGNLNPLPPPFNVHSDGIVDVDNVHLNGAEFNAVVHLAHMDNLPLVSVIKEESLLRSTYTIEIIKRWIFRNQLEIGGTFQFIKTFPHPFYKKLYIIYSLTGSEGVALQAYVKNIDGSVTGVYGFPLYGGGMNYAYLNIDELPTGAGPYIVKFYAYDMNGKMTNSISTVPLQMYPPDGKEVKYPATKIDSGPDSIVSEKDADFSFSASEADWYYYRLDKNPWESTANNSVSFMNLSPGIHTFYVQAFKWVEEGENGIVDPYVKVKSWDVASAPSVFSIGSVSTPDVPNIDQKGNIYLPSLITNISWEASHATDGTLSKYQLYVRPKDEEWTIIRDDIPSNITSITVSPSKEGSYELKVRAIDSYSNWRDSDGRSSLGDVPDPDKKLEITFDISPPVINLNLDPPGISPNNDTVNDEMLIEYSVTDSLSPTAEVKLTLYRNNQPVGILENSLYSLTPDPYSLTWTGQIGSYVSEGKYVLELAATDLAGNTETATVEVLVDFQPPKIEAVALSNEYFSPNGDGKKDDTEIKFNLLDNFAHKMFTTVQVENEYGELAAKIIEREELAPGAHSFTWEGTSISDGSYSLRIFAEDSAGNLGTSDPITVVIDTVPPEIEQLLADPNPFTPNNDGVKDTTTFNYRLSEPCFADLKIYKDDGTLFLQRGLYNVTQEDIEWDGRGARGELLGGEYTYSLYAEDQAANIATSEPQVIIVDREPSLIPYAFAEPDPFSAANNDYTSIRYYVSRDNLEISVSILGRDGAVIKDLVLNEVKNKGEHSIAWYGDYNPGYAGPFSSRDSSKVPDGAYEFKISAYDAYNKANGDNSNTVYVDNTPPVLDLYPVDLDLADQTATVGYFLPESSSVEVSVHKKDGSLLEELISQEQTEVGEHYVSWNMAGVSPGRNYFKIIAEDSAKNRDEKVTEIFSIPAENELAIVNLSASPNPFTPNGDGLTDLTRISYQISGGAPDYTVNVDIQTQTGSTVKTLIENETQVPGTYSYYWDGKDDGGATIDDGRYEYVIMAQDKLEAEVDKQGTLLVVSTRPTVDLSTSLPVFSPNGDGSKDTVTFNYSIDYPAAYITGEALVKLEVLDATGEAVWSQIFNHTAGSYVYEYNGLTANGLQLTAGNYYVKASAEDALGSTAVPKTIGFTVDYENPVVTISEVTPNPFSPDPNGINDETAIAYTVSKDSDVTIQIRDLTGAVIRELLNSERVSASALKALTVPTVVWDGKDTSGTIVSDAAYEVFVSAIDDAGNTGEAVAEVVVDNNTEYSSELPPIRNIDIQPYYAKAGAAVTIDFSVAEELLSQPVVNVGGYTATYLGSEKISSARYDYHYSHTIGDDPEGGTNVQIAITDLAGNVSSTEGEFVVDKTAPGVSNLSVDPNPATAGEATISFNVSEALQQAPVVYIAQNGADPVLAAVSGQWSAAGGNVEAKYNVVSGFDGSALITIEATDLAGNLTLDPCPLALTVDTIAPTFTGIQAGIAGNPDFNDYAKEGSEVTVRFETSEDLQFNPDVKINNNSASYDSLISNEYTYKYTIDNNDDEGNATILISGFDYAGNEGTAETSDPNESFVIDLEDPTVEIAQPGSSEIIASPSPFFTNADPNDTQDRPNYTTLRYETSEYGLVTLKVYRVDKTKTADQYTRDDFTGTPVAALIAGSWTRAGVHNYVWNGVTAIPTYDTNNDGYADSGKYAFIVEVRDKAGNVTQRLWGGTVWIQNNVLQLEQPGTIGINPDPLNFSPNGNSVDTTTKFWFKVKLGISPAAPAGPERIEILALPGDMQWLTGIVKKVGTYTVRVYDSGGSLVRTIEKDKDMYSAADTFVIWDGRVGTGADLLTPGGFAADGDYRLVVEVDDFAGNPAYGEGGGTTLERWVKVDSTLPTITNNQAGDDTWRNSSGTAYDVDFSDDGSKLDYAQYKIRRPNGSETAWISLPVTSGSNLFKTDWSIDFSDTYCHEGTNYVSVRVYDIAGNYKEVSDVFYVKKDTKDPSSGSIAISNTYGGTAGYTKQTGVNLALSSMDQNEPDCSYVTRMKIWNDGEAEPGAYISYSTSQPWNIRDTEGTRTVYVKFGDGAGNWSGISSASIIYDKTGPDISNISDSPDPFSPGNADGNKDDITIWYSIDEFATVSLYIDGVNKDNTDREAGGPYSFYRTNAQCSSLGEGTHSYYTYAVDRAGNPTTSSTYNFTVDNTPPSSPSGAYATSDDGVANIYWNSVNGAAGYYIYRSSTYNGSYSKVSGLVQATSYQNTGLSNGTKYWFKVKACDAAGNEGGFSNFAAATPGKMSEAKVVYTESVSSSFDVYKANYDLSSPTRLTYDAKNQPSPYWYVESRPYAWMSNGQILSATHSVRMGSGSVPPFLYDAYIKIMDSDGTNPRVVYHLASSSNGDSAEIFYPIISPDGSKIVYQKLWMPGYSELWIINSDGTGNQKLTSTSAYGKYYYPGAFSYDGQKIYYFYNGSGYNQVYVINIDGTGNSKLIDDPSYDYGVIGLAPDGARLFLIKQNASIKEIWQMHLFSGELSKVYDATSPNGYCVGPDGRTYPRSKQNQAYSPFIPNMGTLAIKDGGVSTAALSVPLLESPDNNATVNAIRPTFQWKHHKLNTQEYKLDLAKNDTFTISNQTFTKNENAGSPDKDDPTLYHYTYSIHEFDPGLDRDTYYWRVTANATNESATSEVRSFTVAPQLTITGVTNYPNPFNPNREATKIRYRLGATADEVKIRIYDVVGSLVKQLDNCPTDGEGSSVWQKYNDVSWDGKNGRGDVVVNGIYPFEVIARLGDKSVSARGKMAVLK